MKLPDIVALLKRRERERCAVCQLRPEIREQLKIARKEHIATKDQIAYLAELGYTITARELLRHHSREHD